MTTKIILQLCMGSACHQFGVYEVLPTLQTLLTTFGLDETVEIRGAFCLGPCTNGIVLKVAGHQFLDINPHNVEARFKTDILPYLR